MVNAKTSVLEGHHKSLESSLIGVGICRIWELTFAGAIGRLISCSLPGLSAKDSGSDFLSCHSPRV
jgi:hypothetical protein